MIYKRMLCNLSQLVYPFSLFVTQDRNWNQACSGVEGCLFYKRSLCGTQKSGTFHSVWHNYTTYDNYYDFHHVVCQH